jgi:hypothetical protein
MIPRSEKIFDITGIEVTAMEMATTIFKAMILLAGPRN